MKLIVNADDFGFHDNATMAIARCIHDGIVTNTTLMMNMPGTEKAVAVARDGGFADRVGVHINVSEGRPLTDAMRRSKTFCDADGMFKGTIRTNRLLRFFLPAEDCRLLADEIRAQIRSFLKTGLPLRHYDSHGGVHNYLSILPISLACAKEFGFVTTRIFGNMSSNHHGGKMSFLRKCYIRRVISVIDSYGFKRTDYRGYSWDFHRQFSTIEPSAVVEIMCHPQYRLADNTISMDGKLVDWKTPYEDSLGTILQHRDAVDMISFGDLARG